MKPTIATLLSTLLAVNSLAVVRGEHAAYVGGTVTTLKPGLQGTIDASDEKILRFEYEKGVFELPYQQIVTLEFGEKVGYRVGAALVGMVALGLPGLLILMSKKKKHFLTVGYRNEGGQGQAAVFEIAKGTVSSIIPALEARTGKRVEMESSDGFEAGHAEAPHVPPPPEPTPVAPIATLTVQSEPPGAEVNIDAKPFGLSPVTTTVPPGLKYILMKRDGYENWAKDIELKAGQSQTISAELRKKEQATPNIIVVTGAK